MQLPKPISKVLEILGHISLVQWVWAVGGSVVIGALTWVAHQPLWIVALSFLLALALGMVIVDRFPRLWRRLFGAKLVAEGLYKATNTPSAGNTAVRLIVRNRGSKLTGLVAHLSSVDPPLLGFPHQIHLPLALATTTRLDAFRAGHEPRPNQPFNLNARESKHIELFWLGTAGALEGTITHQAGDSQFLVYPGYVFEIEISGETEPMRCRVRLLLTDDETGKWGCEIIR